MQAYDNGHTTNKLGYKPKFGQILRLYVLKHFRVILRGLYVTAEAERGAVLALLYYFVKPDKRAAANKQYICGVYPKALLLGVLSAALRGYVCDRAFYNLQKSLLYTLARNVAGYGNVFALPCDFIYFVDINYAALSLCNIEVGILDKL